MTSGRSQRASAFLVFANDVDPARRDAYERWHGGHHVPQRLTVPGILRAARYRAAETGPHEYLTVYDLADIAVLASRPYRHLVEEPDAITQAMRPHLRNPLRLACHAVAAANCRHQRYLVMLRMPPGADARAKSWRRAQLERQPSLAIRLGRVATDAGGHPLSPSVPESDNFVALMLADEFGTALSTRAAGSEPADGHVFSALYECIERF